MTDAGPTRIAYVIGELGKGGAEYQLYELVRGLDRTRFAPIYDYIWASGVGPRVENPALMLIDPYPWSAPLEELRLKKR